MFGWFLGYRSLIWHHLFVCFLETQHCRVPHKCNQAILTRIYQTLAPLTNFPFPQSPQNGATPHSPSFQHNGSLFLNAKFSIGFHFILPGSHKLQHDVLFKPTH
jgi:hypothetical protein